MIKGVLIIAVIFCCVFAEESWFTTFHQMAQRGELQKQNQLKQQSMNVKERMNYNIQQIVVELQKQNQVPALFSCAIRIFV